MSLRRGDRSKTGQKHQNTTAYKAGLHGRTKKMKEASSVALVGLCERCKEKIEWKLKYDKYKPLSVPKKCVLCQEKRVKQAYYQVCQKCVTESGVCAKCRKDEVVESFPPTTIGQDREEAEFQQRLTSLCETEKSEPSLCMSVQTRQEGSTTDQGGGGAVTTSDDNVESSSELVTS